MNIEELNRKHFLETDMYYRVGYGLSSKLLSFHKGILVLEVVLSKKWNKNYNQTAQELGHLWKKTHRELNKAVACKVYIVDTKKYPYKQHLIHKGIKPGYDAKKGIIFRNDYLN